MGAVRHGDGDPHGFAEGDLQIGRKHRRCEPIMGAAYRSLDAVLLLSSEDTLMCAPF